MITTSGSEDLNRLRHRYIRVLSIASIMVTATNIPSAVISSAAAGAVNWNSVGLIVGVIALSCLWLILLNRNQQRIAGYGLLIMFVAVAVTIPRATVPLSAAVALVTAAALASPTEFLIVNILVLGRVALDNIQMVVNSPGAIPPELYGAGIIFIALTFVSVVTRYFIDVGQRTASGSRSNADLLQATSEIGEAISQILDLDDLLTRAVNLIRARLDYYHVQIFLVNDTHDQAVLVASTGEVGKQLLERRHQLSVGSQSVIGQVVLRGLMVVASDTSRDPVHYRNELLPNTRAELALPLRDGNVTLGALDIQSTNPNAFTRTDLQALQILADLLATTIRNARLFREQAQTVRDNERLLNDSETNLLEIQRLNQELTRIAWQEYMTDTHAVTGVTLEKDRLSAGTEWSESLIRAGEEGVIINEGDHKSVAVPVMLRGEVIGAIEVESGTETSPETIEMVQAVAQRLALSLENARLYEATRQAATQEQRINDIAARFQAVSTVDELLRITLAELSQMLGAERGSIRLGRFTESIEPNGNGSISHD